MICPRCGRELNAEHYEGDVAIDRCAGCGGTWVEQGELERIQNLHQRDNAQALRAPVDTVADALEMAKQRDLPPISCPRCTGVMDRREYGLASQVLVDTCPVGHGVWLDKGELEALEVWFERMRAEGNEEAGVLGMFASLWSVWKR